MEETSSKSTIEDQSASRKRKRKTYSCIDCRRRKLKCSRDQPCTRCVKDGTECIFRDDGHHSEPEEYDGTYRPYPVLEIEKPGKNAINARERTGSASFVIDQTINLQRKIASLEAKVAKFEAGDRGHEPSNTGSSKSQEGETRFFKGTSFRTNFYGQTNPTSLFSQFPEIMNMAKDTKCRNNNQQVSRLQKDLFQMRARRKERTRNEAVSPTPSLISLLPSRSTMDYMLQLYFDTFETTYRIVHQPTFWEEYQASPPEQWRESFLAIVLTVLATVSCVGVSELNFKDDVSTARIASQRWVAAAEDWWNRQSQKHLKIETFQVKILLLLAKATNAIKRKRAWAESGFLLRIAISAGLQREPSDLSGRINVFDQEMRRRLWATVFEWDLEQSLSRGVPPMAASIPSDCRAPLNIDDAALHKEAEALPDAKPLSERTDTSFLQISLQSLSLRTSLASLLNDPNIQLSWSEVLCYEERIQQELEALPEWTRALSTLNAVLLDLQLRQYFLWLHSSHARGPPGSRTAYSRLAIVNAAAKMIDVYSKLSAADVNALNMLRSDMYRSIVTISVNLIAEAKAATLAWSSINELRPIIEKGFLYLEDKVLKWGESYNHMWFAAAAYATAQVRLDPKLGEARVIAIERVAKIYYKVMAYQENNHKNRSNSSVTAATANASTSIANGHPSANGLQHGNELSAPGQGWQDSPSAAGSAGLATPNGYTDLLKNPGEPIDLGDFPDMTEWMADEFFGFDASFM